MPLVASANSGYTFNNWAGNVANTNSASTSVIMSAPESVTANFTLAPTAPDLAITKTHSGDFNQGDTNRVYTIVVSNVGGPPTSGKVWVADLLPSGLSFSAIYGSGWSCSSSLVKCSRSDALAPGHSYPPITVKVNVSSHAPSSVTNLAGVLGGGDVSALNNAASDPTTINGKYPDLTIIKSHSGNFYQGQTGAIYKLLVKNVGQKSTSGTVSVTDLLPPDLTATSISGSGWSCHFNTLTCTQSTSLAVNSSYSYIVVKVNVASGAPPSVINSATVSGGGENNTANNQAADPTQINLSTATPTTTTINAATIAYGQTAHITVKVSPSNATGSVSLMVGANTYGPTNVSGGSATFNISNLHASIYLLSANFTPIGNFAPSNGSGSLTVNRATPTVKVTGGIFTSDGSPHPATGSVTGVNDANLGTPAFTYTPGGSSAPVAVGTYSVTGSFAGNSDYNPASASATITINPPSAAGLTFSATTVNFGNLKYKQTVSRTVKVTNSGRSIVKFNSISIVPVSGPGESNFSFTSNCGSSLKAGYSCNLYISFTGYHVGSAKALLKLFDNVSGSPQQITLLANVLSSDAELSTDELNFGKERVGRTVSRVVTLSNQGNLPLLISDIDITGSSDFRQSDNCPEKLAANASCRIVVTYTPSSRGSDSARLTVLDNDPDTDATSLFGRGGY